MALFGNNNSLYGSNQQGGGLGYQESDETSGVMGNYETDYGMNGGVDYVNGDQQISANENKGSYGSNSAYGAIASGAAAGIGAAARNNNNPSMDYDSGISTVQDTYEYDRSDLVDNSNQFDQNIYYQNFQDDNVYDYNAKEGGNVVMQSASKGAEKGGQYGGLFGTVFGFLGGATSGLGKNIVSKRKANEYEEQSRANEEQYKNQQMSYINNRNDELRGIAQQQQLANRGVPNYSMNAYNIG